MPAIESPILGRMLRPLTAQLRGELLQAVAALECDRADDERYHDLADRNTEGTLTADERGELESIVAANTLLSVLKTEARAALDHRAA